VAGFFLPYRLAAGRCLNFLYPALADGSPLTAKPALVSAHAVSVATARGSWATPIADAGATLCAGDLDEFVHITTSGEDCLLLPALEAHRYSAADLDARVKRLEAHELEAPPLLEDE